MHTLIFGVLVFKCAVYFCVLIGAVLAWFDFVLSSSSSSPILLAREWTLARVIEKSPIQNSCCCSLMKAPARFTCLDFLLISYRAAVPLTLSSVKLSGCMKDDEKFDK